MLVIYIAILLNDFSVDDVETSAQEDKANHSNLF